MPKTDINPETLEACVVNMHETRFTRNGDKVRWPIDWDKSGAKSSDRVYCTDLTLSVIEKLVELHPAIGEILKEKKQC